MTKSKTTIHTSLPYCLYRVDSRFFKLNDDANTKIRFSKIETTPNRRTASSQNIETIRDRWGIDAHSDVGIYTDKTFEDVQDCEVFALKIINDFVQRYRHYERGAVHLVPLAREDLFGFNMISDGHGSAVVSLAGGIATSNPLLVHEVSSKIEKSLTDKEQIPFYEELFSNAEQYIYQLSYRHSVLESVIALELVISSFILQGCAQKGISESDAKNYVKDVGLTGNIRVTIKLLLENATLPDDEVFERCKAGITIRNKIVHEGRKDVLESEAIDVLKYSRELVSFLLPLTKPN